ncbi:TonB-dependent receptor [Sphingomonas sp.]|uniref:TonB-dependent receptor n=1 Tax=Sphingomonas sp. TaxID=28214 RepID=UPI0025D93DB9|nr:TonB-dependent receptor [Sphingomonas sp.]
MNVRTSTYRRLLLCALLSSTAPLSAQVAGGTASDPAATNGANGAAQAQAGSDLGGEIVVTATRTAQTASKVPISITAYTQAKLDQQGVRQIDDLYRLTPGVNFERTNLRSNISIRGISSGAGAATTGIYIDDTPIQVRVVGYSATNAYPAVFDLARVEVLRGPQGTLFGAGSEGGTIRFIQEQPNLDHFSGYARTEVATTEGGALSYEGGVALGGPIVQDKIAFRASVYFRRDGGYIDRVIGLPTVLSSNGSAGPENSLLFNTTGIGRKDSNSTETTSARLALTFAPTETLTITPSVMYQKIHSPDNITQFWPSASDKGSTDLRTPMWIPSVDATHVAIPGAPLTEPLTDRFWLPSLAIKWELGGIELFSNSSYFDRASHFTPNYTQLYELTYARRQVVQAGDFAISPQDNYQKNFSQEVRLQSGDADSRFRWVVGGFYTRNKQRSVQDSRVNFVSLVPSIANATVPGYPAPLPAVNNGAPFGAGYSAYINYYGMAPLNGVTTYYADLRTVDEQYAGFGEATFKVTPRLSLIGGVRVSRNKTSIDAIYNGPNSNLNAPRGYACVPGTGAPGAPACIPVAVGQYKPGEGPFAPAFANGGAGQAQTAVTPKFGVSWQATDRNLLYFTASKGFRPGGAQPRQPSTCNDQLVALGYVDGSGKADSPTSYNSDSVWSYEAGTKNRIGRIQLDLSGYYIKWKNIQSTVSLSTCVQSIIDNLGSATSKGFDLQAQLPVFSNLLLSAAVAYNDTTFNDATVLGGRTLYTDGSAIPGSGAPWTITLSGQYDFELLDRKGYLRADYTHASKFRRTGASDPGTVSYDLMVPPRPATNMVNARVGMTFEGIDASLFINNMFNSLPSLGLSRNINQPVYTNYTFRPRTVGLTVSYRY